MSYVNTEFKRANQKSGKEVYCTENSLASLILKSVHKYKNEELQPLFIN